MFSIAGEKAKTANIAKLEEAKKRLENGEDKQKVWEETGWYIAKDGKPRFEISDRDFKVNEKAIDKWLEDDKAYITPHTHVDISNKLYDFISHKELFEAYPELKDYSVQLYDEPSTTRGSFSAENKTIKINMDFYDDLKSPNRFARDDSRTELKKTLIHEIQHAIQDYEGFAKGSNPESVLKKKIKVAQYEAKRAKREKLNETLDGLNNATAKSLAYDYMYLFDKFREAELDSINKANDESFEKAIKLSRQLKDLKQSFVDVYGSDEPIKEVENFVYSQKDKANDKPTLAEISESNDRYKRHYGEGEASKEFCQDAVTIFSFG